MPTADPGPGTAPHRLTIAETGRLLRDGGLTARGLTEHYLARIAELDGVTRAFVLVTDDEARHRADLADRELAAGRDRGPLHGIPYALKDILDTAGIPTTNHSHVTRDRVPDTDSAAHERLVDGGAVLLGKLATHEFALGGPSPELPFPPARNPWDPDRVPGGSSSGAGAAVAAGLVPVAVGSDTSGSIRGPATACGAVGLKPTYGLVSRRGAYPLSWSLDHVGPLTWYVDDAARVLSVLAGHDPADPASLTGPAPDPAAGADGSVAGLRVACPRSWWADDPALSPEVAAAVEDALAALADAGARVVDVDVPPFALFNACGRVTMAAEAFAVHEEALRADPSRFGRYTVHRIAPAAGLSAADLLQAGRVRRELRDAVERDVFARCDVLLTASALAPPAPFTAFGPDWPPPPEAAATRTVPFNVTGHPAMAVPFGHTGGGLPLGVQVAARFRDEATVLRVGRLLERARPTRELRPLDPAVVGQPS